MNVTRPTRIRPIGFLLSLLLGGWGSLQLNPHSLGEVSPELWFIMTLTAVMLTATVPKGVLGDQRGEKAD